MYENISSMNRYLKCNKNDYIMHVNIRSMSANFNKLKILLGSLACKPSVIVYTESFIQVNYKINELEGYKSYYNESKLNQYDGVMVFVDENVEHESVIIECGRINFININIKLSNNRSIDISAVYKSHEIPKT